MCEDYRLTRYCDDYHDINERKQELEALIRQECPQTRIIYNKIRKRELRYIDKFMQIYNFRCAYCGVSNRVLLNVHLFEVDHFICESSFSGSSAREAAGCISNLVLACRCCNRDKSNLEWPREYDSLLHPDRGELIHVFRRDNNYYVRIADNYKSDEIIVGFYNRLRLGSQKRRLDYLLTEMIGIEAELCRKRYRHSSLELLRECINLLSRRRNSMY
ncbi:HNH endonuclease domain-containing protein [Veillonella sp.]|jgi:putative CRISPR-associated protein, csn1 family|uniref:HNH endonuclease domain-containing protein n=1 Tax=Veillonella sp. TaxID=1926307 RepID=UPI00290A9DEB|nr:HNH endonuclease domain-containing protein [Veillonella sp.]MDU5495543.1 HNH endonuclease domain-containing protein [Veillonella sp.]